MKRVLVTGAAGFIAHHFVEHVLKATDWDVVGTASFRHRGCPLRLAHLMADPRLKLVTTDLAAPISERVIDAIGEVDYIVNFASESHVDRSIADPRPFILNNVELAVSMLEYARAVKPRAFLQMSTDEVYGPAPAGYAHREWDSLIPSNPYSASKAAQEAVAISYWRTYGVPVAIVNSMNLIGERQDPEKFVPMVLSKVMAGEVVPIHGRLGHDYAGQSDDIGSRMYLHARNLADGLLFLLLREPALYPATDRPDRWNVVGEREVDNLTMAQMVARHAGRDLKYRLVDFHSARPGHDRRYALDGMKLAKAGWKQPVDLDESLAKTVAWTLNHPEWLK